MTTPRLRWLVADSLTGKLVGRLGPGDWSYTDPLTGSGEGTLKVPLPTDPGKVAHLLGDLTRPHVRQIVAQSTDTDRILFGGPILGDPARSLENELTVRWSDWRAWFYAAAIRPDPDTDARVEYLRTADSTGGQVEQCQAIVDLAELGLDTTGKPRLVTTTPPDSTILRDVTARMFKTSGAAMDNVARRERGPDWWTDLVTDPADPTKVIARLRVGWPERALSEHPIRLRYVLGESGCNLVGFSWPAQQPPPSRVLGHGGTPPDDVWAVAEHPDLTDGLRLAWDEVWSLPEGVKTPASAFEHSFARLEALGQDLGVAEVMIRPEATDLAAWGPGDRARLTIRDGGRDVDLDSVRIISRTLTGRGSHVTGVKATLALSAVDADTGGEPIEVSEGE